MNTLMDRYRDRIGAKVECLDRVIISGTLPRVCHAQGMTSILFEARVRMFDYVQYVQPFRDRIRETAEQLAPNAAWSPLFFGLHRPGIAFADIVLLCLALVATVWLFLRRSAIAGLLLVPYLLWVSFAAALNFTIWRLNA